MEKGTVNHFWHGKAVPVILGFPALRPANRSQGSGAALMKQGCMPLKTARPELRAQSRPQSSSAEDLL
jgi:hypothetical protein